VTALELALTDRFAAQESARRGDRGLSMG